jgi:hypothetical protein
MHAQEGLEVHTRTTASALEELLSQDSATAGVIPLRLRDLDFALSPQEHQLAQAYFLVGHRAHPRQGSVDLVGLRNTR